MLRQVAGGLPEPRVCAARDEAGAIVDVKGREDVRRETISPLLDFEHLIVLGLVNVAGRRDGPSREFEDAA